MRICKTVAVMMFGLIIGNSMLGQVAYIQPSPTSPDEEVTLFIENDLTDLAYIYSFYVGVSITVLTAIGIIIFFFYQRR